MEKYNYCADLKDAFYVKIFDEKILVNRINNLIYACGFDISKEEYKKNGNIQESYFAGRLNYEYGDKKLRLSVYKKLEDDWIDCTSVIGNATGLYFILRNYSRYYKVIKPLYEIYIEKIVDKSHYFIEIQSNDKKKIKYIIKKDEQEFVFYSKHCSFNSLLDIIKLFVNHPEIVFETYKEMILEKRVSFSKGEINSVTKRNK